MRRIFLLLIVSLLMISFVPIITGQWISNPEENTIITTMSGEQVLPKIAVDDNGYAYVSWFSNEAGNYNVRLQRLDRDGNALWPENGVLVSSEPQDTWITDYDLTVDPSGYAVITFSDIRSGQSNPVSYRISPNGDLIWGQTGIMLANDNNFDPSPVVCVTTFGNSIFAWQSLPDSGESQVRLQKISPDGQLLWGDGIIFSQSDIDFTAPYLLQAENDSVYLIWHKETGPYYAPNRGLYVQKLDVNGNFMWTSDVEVYAPVPSSPVVYLKMCRDDYGGIVFSWYRAIDATHFYSYVQWMDADGNIGMPANGVLASTTATRIHMYPVPAFLNQTHEIVLFFSEQDLNQNMRGIYAQKFDLQGNRLWGDEGIQLIGLSNYDYGLFMADGKDNKAICIYQAAEFGNYLDSKIQAVMLDDQGNFVWPEQFVDLCTYKSQKLQNVMTNYYKGQWVAVWQDLRNDYGDIYAQNIQPDGTLGVVVNNPPNAPEIDGPIKGKAGTSLDYTFNSVDPDGDQVKYIIDWGDGNIDTTDLNPSSTNVIVAHTWDVEGTFVIKVKAEDEYGLVSPESTLSVTIPRFKITPNTFLQRFLEEHQIIFQLIQKLLQVIV
jgi:hypothetical protein